MICYTALGAEVMHVDDKRSNQQMINISGPSPSSITNGRANPQYLHEEFDRQASPRFSIKVPFPRKARLAYDVHTTGRMNHRLHVTSSSRHSLSQDIASHTYSIEAETSHLRHWSLAFQECVKYTSPKSRLECATSGPKTLY